MNKYFLLYIISLFQFTLLFGNNHNRIALAFDTKDINKFENINTKSDFTCEISAKHKNFYNIIEFLKSNPNLDIGIKLYINKFDNNNYNILTKDLNEQIELVQRHTPQATHLFIDNEQIVNEKIMHIITKLSEKYNLYLLHNKFIETSIDNLLQNDILAQKNNNIFQMNNKVIVVKSISSIKTADQCVKHISTLHRQQVIPVNYIFNIIPKNNKYPQKLKNGIANYIEASKKEKLDIHSIMVIKHGEKIYEYWKDEKNIDTPHILNSVSKTFTALAIGFAVKEKKINISDKVISFFPESCPELISSNLSEMTIKDLLTMTCGHEKDPSTLIRRNEDWVKGFLNYPVKFKPGTYFMYNSMCTYMLSAILLKVTGESLIDYLYPRLFLPLGIANVHWEKCPLGITCGGWGLFLRTEDIAKMGLLFLNNGKWKGKQIIDSQWIHEASKKQVNSRIAGLTPEDIVEKGIEPETSDWMQGYGYQMWRCRHNGYRADGANGQFVIVLPKQDIVIASTSHINNMQLALDLIWEYILPNIQ